MNSSTGLNRKPYKMFHRKKKPHDYHPIPWRQEESLIRNLKSNIRENTYLLGLLQDYSLRGIHQMKWGKFYLIDEPIPQVLYQDVTGLVVVSHSMPEAIRVFSQILHHSEIRTTRIISQEDTAIGLHNGLIECSSKWAKTRVEFPEVGMVLERQRLAGLPGMKLRMAYPEEAEVIAKGSAHAMAEEIEVDTQGSDFDRLVQSKAELIERNRYYILEEKGEIKFQAYLSARMPETSQIQGVWVPPPFRNQGIATHCIAEMCRQVLEFSESIVLRVQVRNQPARTAYEKVGFKHFLNYRSIWYA